MQSSDQWKCSCDIEICFQGIPFDELSRLVELDGTSLYSLVDRTDQGWGSVITRDDCWDGDRREMSNMLLDFLDANKTSIQNARDKYINTDPILRVGVYHETYSFTFSISPDLGRLLDRDSIKLDITIYPGD